TAQRPAAGREELPGRAPHRRGPRDGPLTRTAPDPLITLGPARRRWPPTYRRCSGRELLGDGGGLGLAVQADPVPGLRVVDDAAVEGRDAGGPELAHRQLQLLVEDLQHAQPALLAGRGVAVTPGTADGDQVRPHREGLDDVVTGADPAVEDDGEIVAHGVDDRGQHADGARRGVELAATVVGDVDALHADLPGAQ